MRRFKRGRNAKNIREKLEKIYAKDKKQMERVFNGITLGTVVDTNDPQQMGRVRVFCPSLGDSIDNKLSDLPWCIYITPFGGTLSYGNRGPEDDLTNGPLSYGQWAIPKIGATAAVVCSGGDPKYRMWLGCIYSQFAPHTMPHGRYFYDGEEKPEGPLSSTEQPIQPLFKNLGEAFEDNKTTNFEWRTRGADDQVAAVDNIRIPETVSEKADDILISTALKTGAGIYTSTQGYDTSRNTPEFTQGSRPENFDPMFYSVTTPGFHSFSMNDKAENCKIRLRSTAGNQILLDDTNERIYISTAKGKNWIEIDQEGNIDINTDGNFSVHAKEDINFTSDKKIRMYAGEGIHLRTEDEYRLHADKDIHVRTEQNMRSYTTQNMYFESNMELDIHALMDMNVYTDTVLHIQSKLNTHLQSLTAAVHFKSSTTMHLDSGAQMNLLAGGNIHETGSNIHLNGPPATPATNATEADLADERWAFTTSRVPEHEPWGRVATKPGIGSINTENEVPETDVPNLLTGLVGSGRVLETFKELTYEDELVGKKDRDRTLTRGTHWRR